MLAGLNYILIYAEGVGFHCPNPKLYNINIVEIELKTLIVVLELDIFLKLFFISLKSIIEL